MPYAEVAAVLDWPGVHEYAIQHALEREGYKRRVGRVKPPISEKNRVLRLAWAQDHLTWTWKQWCMILWTDETWVTGGRYTKTYVTRKKGEELEPICVIDKIQRKSGWMFWGCFSGLTGKGPGIFWEKAWKTINKDFYIEHTIPVINAFIHEYPELSLMQDHAPGHAAKLTLAEFEKLGIRLIFWPPFSPDLNPIETVWNLMKNWIQEHYPGWDKLSYKVLREAVQGAWDAVGWQELEDLLVSMPRRCEAVIAANGMYTKF
jgi:transposase